MITREDLEFLPYKDVHVGRIFTKTVKENIKLFIDEFRGSEFGSRLVAEGLATGSHLDQILETAQERYGHDDVNMQEFTATAKSLWMAGDLEPEVEPVESEEPEVERDRLGRPLSPKARQWKIWTSWCNSPDTSMKQIFELRRTNPAFAEFYSAQSLQERSVEIDGAVQPLGTQAVRQDKSIRITQELRDFAQAYRTMSTEEVRRKSRLATNPDAEAFNRNVELASLAGIL